MKSSAEGKYKRDNSSNRHRKEKSEKRRLSKRLHQYRHKPNKGRNVSNAKKSKTLTGAYAEEIKKFIIKTAIEDGELDTGALELAAGMTRATAKNSAEKAKKPVLFIGGIAKRLLKTASKKATKLLMKLLLRVMKAAVKLVVKAVSALAVVLGVSIPIVLVVIAVGVVSAILGAFVIDTYGNAAMGAKYIQEYRQSIEKQYDDYDEVEFVGGDSALDNNDDMLLIFMARNDIEPEEAIENITERMLYCEEEEIVEETIIEVEGSTVKREEMCYICKGVGNLGIKDGYIPVCEGCNNEEGKVSFEVCMICNQYYEEEQFLIVCGKCTEGKIAESVVECDFCYGSGESYMDRTKKCEFCYGTGIIEIIYVNCTMCDSGYITGYGCKKCGKKDTYTKYCDICGGTGEGEYIPGGVIDCPECNDGVIVVIEKTEPTYEIITETRVQLKVHILTAKDWEEEYYIPNENRYENMLEMFKEYGYKSGQGDTVCRYFINN